MSADGCLPGLFNLTENRTERIGMAMSNEPTVVELTFEGDDRVFFVVTDVHTMAEEDQAAAAYLESYEGGWHSGAARPLAGDGHV